MHMYKISIFFCCIFTTVLLIAMDQTPPKGAHSVVTREALSQDWELVDGGCDSSHGRAPNGQRRMEFTSHEDLSSANRLLDVICNGPRPEDHIFCEARFVQLNDVNPFDAIVRHTAGDTMSMSVMEFVALHAWSLLLNRHQLQ